MANLYLIDKPFGENGLQLAAADPQAQVVLIQDGVYLDASDIIAAEKPVYAVEADVAKRGLEPRLPDTISRIDYPALVALIFQHKVINFA